MALVTPISPAYRVAMGVRSPIVRLWGRLEVSGLDALPESGPVLVPEARIVCCTTQGPPDIPRFPKRPHVRVRFFAPAGGQRREDESAAELGARILAELRAEAPITAAGRCARSASPAGTPAG